MRESKEPFPCTTSSWESGRRKFSEKMYMSPKVSALWCHFR